MKIKIFTIKIVLSKLRSKMLSTNDAQKIYLVCNVQSGLATKSRDVSIVKYFVLKCLKFHEIFEIF